MSEAFLGLTIKVQLHSGLNLQGTVAHIDPATQQMTLKDVELMFPGQPAHFTSVYGVNGNEIDDLQVCEKKPVPAVSKSCSVQRKKVKPQKKNNTPVKSLSSNTGRKQQQPRKENGWANQDVDGFREKEFDFQANLNMFDKKKVFAEIRELDDTTTDTLLVTLNRLPKEQRKNLLPTENVLESDSIGDESDTESRTTSDESVPLVRHNTSHRPLQIRTTESHIPCTLVSPLQMAHAEHECKTTGPSSWQLVENGGRAIAMLILQILGKQPQPPSPAIIVLAGDSKIGGNALAATRHLLNRGFHVAVCLNDQPSCESVLDQCKMVESAGGKVIRREELYHWTPDLVIDAMHQDEDVGDMLVWASQQGAPILSVDRPSSDEIRPRWTVCLGAPKSGCVSQDVTGELYMADIGIPKICWKRAGVKNYTTPWGADFLIALEYVI